jgi:hypothetical protein
VQLNQNNHQHEYLVEIHQVKDKGNYKLCLYLSS